MMKPSISFVLAISIVALSCNASPSFSKEVWLDCKTIKDFDGIEGKPRYSEQVKLDYTKERFELPNRGVLGKATFFQDQIDFQYTEGLFTYKWTIDRANLNFIYSLGLTEGALTAPRTSSGICKVIPAPSSKKRLI